MQTPPALVLGCNTPHGLSVLSDWIEEQTGVAPDFTSTTWSNDQISGYILVNPYYGTITGNGRGDGHGYGSGRNGFGDGAHHGDRWGDGYGDGSYDAYGDGEGNGFGDADGGS